jgi:hypothetical protein
VHWSDGGRPRDWPATDWPATLARPLSGLRVLDLTRILAGPVATRMLAGFGADVLRIDPPDWDEPDAEPEVTLGKRCTRLDLRDAADRATFEELLNAAHVLVHGYRPGALAALGYGASALPPGLIEVTLDAYGWTGPWAGRRGFDSLVQMSSGIAHQGRLRTGRDRPTPLPVQALDHATGYLMATAVLRLLTTGGSAGLSLARVAELLKAHPQDTPGNLSPDAMAEDLSDLTEPTPWGPARRLKPALALTGIPIRWDLPVTRLGSGRPEWSSPA